MDIYACKQINKQYTQKKKGIERIDRNAARTVVPKEMPRASALYLEAAMSAKAGLRASEEESTQTPMAHRTSVSPSS
jgi:hypothetical protein